MKYKVVIVDDEEIIAEGLSKVIDWESLGCEVVATAFDAVEGSEAIRTHSPQMLLTDINMPNVTGLEMLAGLRSEFPTMQVTIISGYNDFTLAQEAMRLGACRYLLKPTKMDEIYEAIRQMKAVLDKELSKDEPATAEKPSTAEKAAIQGEASGEENSEASHFIVRNALAYIKEHHAEKLTLNQVAEHCYVSQWHLSKLLNGQLKQTYYEILNQIRIDRAKELLKDGSLRISDISDMVGYGEAAHFSRVFKKETGMSANEFRQSL